MGIAVRIIRAKTTPKAGEIIISRSNTETLVGASAYIDSNHENLYLADKLWQTISKPNIDMKWLSYTLASDHSRHTLSKLATGTSGSMKNITKGELLTLKVPTPPFSEQRKIAQILSTWDKAIITTESLITNSQQQKKPLMQQLLTGKKRFAGFELEWDIKTFSDFFTVGSSKRVLQSEWRDSGVPFYRTRKLVSFSKREPFRSEIFISEELYINLKDKYGLPTEGDFLVSGVGTLGISYLVQKGDKFYFKDGNVLWFKKNVQLNSSFFKYCFHSRFVQNQILNQTTITTVGTYTITNAKKTKFLCPPSHEEQQKIASVLTAADQEIDTLQQKLAYLKQEKKALMQQLLTGKRRVVV